MLTKNVLRNNTSEISPSERAGLERAIDRTEMYNPGHVAVQQGVEVDVSLLLVKGLMTRHIDAPDGRRHLVGLHVPGDFVDLHAYALKKLDHDVAALTEVQVAVFPHAALEAIQVSDDRLTRRLWFMTLLDAARHRQWICRLASLDALQRVGHFLCEMNARLLAIEASDGQSFALPMTQSDIGGVRLDERPRQSRTTAASGTGPVQHPWIASGNFRPQGAGGTFLIRPHFSLSQSSNSSAGNRNKGGDT